MKECKVCGAKTEVKFNIEFNATPICERCATAIFLQQARWYAQQEPREPVTYVAVIAETVHRFNKWIDELEDKHPNEFKFKLIHSRTFLNTKTNTEYICMSNYIHPKGYTIDKIIEMDYAKHNKHYDKIMETLKPCLKTQRV